MLEDRERKEKMRDEKEERIRETKIMIALLKKKNARNYKGEKNLHGRNQKIILGCCSSGLVCVHPCRFGGC